MTITNPNLGPLTTVYSASGDNCYSIYQTNDGVLIYGTITDSISLCLPSNFIPYDGYYYSPGVCPSDRTYACLALLGNGGTAATCCPTNYECWLGRSTTNAHACYSELLSDSSFTIRRYISTDGSTSSANVTPFFTAGNFVFASGVVVRRANSDPTWPITDSTTLTTDSEHINSPTSIRSSISGLASDTQSSNSPTSVGLVDDSANAGLTNSAKAGIGVGITLGVSFIIGLTVTAFCIGKRKERLRHKAIKQNYSFATSEFQLDSRQTSRDNMGQHEGVVGVELEEQIRQVELYGRRSPVEMMGQ
ncbi:hypothetical protein F5Y10DRAFT_162629 [Nemania abortiva]|nr:hypothetical protein F5Y10DRAFT_162629 [Nemania abortiva]